MSREGRAVWTIREVVADDVEGIEAVRELFDEYASWLGDVVCSVTLPGEIAALPGVYAPPHGSLLLATGAKGEPLGVVGVRAHDERACEMKRLYVRPEARACGLGRALSETAIDRAIELGYSEMRLTTLPDSMGEALSMYRALGFKPSEPFTDHSHVRDGVPMTYMQLQLR